jgi:hypothetical protein
LFEKHFLLGCLRRAPEIGAAKHFRTGLEGFLGTITPEDVIFLSEWGSDSLHLILFQILERFRFDGKQILLNIASQGRKHSWQAYDLLMKDKLTISDIGRLLGCGNRLIYSDILSLPQASPERDRIKEALSRSYTEEVLAAEARSISRSTPMSLEVVDQLPSWNLFCKYPGAFSRLHRTHQEYWDSDILGALQYLRRYFTDDQGKICAALGKINPVLFDALKPWISYCYSPRESDDPEIKRAINIAMDSSKP